MLGCSVELLIVTAGDKPTATGLGAVFLSPPGDGVLVSAAFGDGLMMGNSGGATDELGKTVGLLGDSDGMAAGNGGGAATGELGTAIGPFEGVDDELETGIGLGAHNTPEDGDTLSGAVGDGEAA